MTMLKLTKMLFQKAMSFTKLPTTLLLTVLVVTTSFYACSNEATELPSEEPAELINIVEVMPEFVGGQEAMFQYIGKEVSYPQVARDKGIEGTVYVGFTVTKTGEIKNVNIKRGFKGNDGGCHEEAMRVVRKMPKWTPGTQMGKTVDVMYTLPLKFKLEDKSDN